MHTYLHNFIQIRSVSWSSFQYSFVDRDYINIKLDTFAEHIRIKNFQKHCLGECWKNEEKFVHLLTFDNRKHIS